MDFAADAGVSPSPQSAFVTCASSLTEGGQTSSHADDTRALMTAVLLGGISQDDLTVSFYSLLYNIVAVPRAAVQLLCCCADPLLIFALQHGCSTSCSRQIAMLLCRPFAILSSSTLLQHLAQPSNCYAVVQTLRYSFLYNIVAVPRAAVKLLCCCADPLLLQEQSL